MFKDFLSLVFPDNCLACSEALNKGEFSICTSCQYVLPKTNYHLSQSENELNKRFWGRVDIRFALSYLRFVKGGMVQKMLYKIKYMGKKEGAKVLGKWYGHDLFTSGYQKEFDLLLPVPLHEKKLKKRGFNQSWLFTQGLSESLNIECLENTLVRISEKTSQTNKSRFERWRNVEDIYKINDIDKIKEKRILLIDDVITTGATFESCAIELLKNGAKEISIVVIASA
jgi:ComF family protein